MSETKYWYNHKSGNLHDFPSNVEHDEFLKRPDLAPLLGVSKAEATKWAVGRTKATMFSGSKPPLFVYSNQPYDAPMKEKVFKANTRLNVTSRGVGAGGSRDWNHISVHTHGMREFPHAQLAVMKLIDKHNFDPRQTMVHHETVEHGNREIAIGIPAEEYVTTNNGAKLWSRHREESTSTSLLPESVVDEAVARILSGDDIDRAVVESAIVHHYFYGNWSGPVQKEIYP